MNVTAVGHQPQADALTYETYFGLTEKPFSLNADSRFVFDSPSYVATRDGLLSGIRRREGLLVLTGQIGTGKTTLCRAVLEDLGRHTYSSLVPDPFASREDLLKMMLIDFGVLSIQQLTTGSLRQASRTELGYLLSEFLDSLTRDAFVVVMIDEAQNLSSPLIEETRILSDTFGAQGRLQIVFVGQPELHARLKSPEMRQVDQRVCGYHRLEPMNREAVGGYVQHRLQVAGLHRGQVLFSPDIIDSLHARTGGVPRLINRVCDRALQLAYEGGADSVTKDVLDAALIEVGAATLSPTWDSIMFAAPAAPAPPAPEAATAAILEAPAPAAPTPAPAVTSAPEPVEEPSAAAVPAAPPMTPRSKRPEGLEEDESFRKEVEYWVRQELSPASRAQQRRPSPARATARPEPRRRADWPRDMRSETYMQRLGRLWVKWISIGVGLIVVVNLGLMAASMASTLVAPAILPRTPVAPDRALPEQALAVAPSAAAATANYLVAVGLFVDARRADALVDVLKREGLAAMHRPVTTGGRQLQQIVLGPFFTRPEAVAELVRLQQLGGYDDARVVDVGREP